MDRNDVVMAAAHRVSIVTLAGRPDLAEPAARLDAVWPEFNHHGDVAAPLFERLDPDMPEYQLLFLDGEDVVARGRTMPLWWDETIAGLPAGMDGAVTGGFGLFDSGGCPNCLCAMAAEVRIDWRSRGLARVILQAMRKCARDHDLAAGLIGPVRPNWKERYPLTPIERYARWTRPDGLPFDPWMRTHARLGAAFLRPEPKSLLITGRVADWEVWVGMAFPETGTYVIPHGLAPLEIDREDDAGRYWEPNVWMHHP